MYPLDLVFLEEVGDAVGQFPDYVILAKHHGIQVQARRVDGDAVQREPVPSHGEQFAGIQQCLAGNAALVEAYAAQGGTPFNHGDLHAKL
jgi:hypothetical protein